MAPHPPDPLGLLLAATIATVVVTSALSLLVLWRHRRAVGRSVRSRATGLPVAARPGRSGGPRRTTVSARHRWCCSTRRTGPPQGGPANDLWRRARRRLHATVAAYVVAGLACGLVDGAVWLAAGRVEIGPRNLLGLAVLFAWPLVPTVLSVLAASRSTRVQAWVGYGVLVPLSTIGTGITPSVTVMLVGVVVVPPALALLTLSGPAFHAVGPFLATPVLLTATGLFLYPSTAQWAVWFGASAEVGTVLAVLATAVIGLAGAGHLVRSARQYARKRAGDQTVTISQWWLFATAWHSRRAGPVGGPRGARGLDGPPGVPARAGRRDAPAPPPGRPAPPAAAPAHARRPAVRRNPPDPARRVLELRRHHLDDRHDGRRVRRARAPRVPRPAPRPARPPGHREPPGSCASGSTTSTRIPTPTGGTGSTSCSATTTCGARRCSNWCAAATASWWTCAASPAGTSGSPPTSRSSRSWCR